MAKLLMLISYILLGIIAFGGIRIHWPRTFLLIALPTLIVIFSVAFFKEESDIEKKNYDD